MVDDKVEMANNNEQFLRNDDPKNVQELTQYVRT